MSEAPYFLAHLGLDTGASAPDVRRAYARQLKRIDQETEPDEFQQLRHCYEVALDWANGVFTLADPDDNDDDAPPIARDGPAAAEAIAHAPAALANPVGHAAAAPAAGPGPSDMAEQALQEMLEQGRGLAAKYDFTKEHWTALLHQALDSPLLLNLEARELFEERVVCWLTSGWQPGNEFLFDAAEKAFDWQAQRRRLYRHGHAGAMINAAIDERAAFEHLPGPSFNALRGMINHMRQGIGDDDRRFARNLPLFREMREVFPAWLAMVASRESIEEWTAIAERTPVEAQLDIGASDDAPWWQRIAAGLVVMVLVRACVNFSADERTTYTAPQQQQQVEYTYERPTQQKIDDIASRIVYQAKPGTPRSTAPGIYYVSLTALGNVATVEVDQSSGDPLFDAAAIKAIKESPGFPINTHPNFTLTFSPK